MVILLLICVTLILALVDIVLKSSVEGSLTTKEERTAFKDKVIIRKVYNKGFSLNMMDDKPEVVKYTSVYIAVLMTIYQMFTLLRKGCPVKKLGLSVMSAGAWSNTFDRWFRGYVIDYIAVPSKNEKLKKLTFNLADIFLVAGGVIVIVASVVSAIKEVFQKES
ncbi:MAG: signal peptidase II [Ruminococcus sp.]|nr:signal peptidase II [Ruminococcus sp.]